MENYLALLLARLLFIYGADICLHIFPTFKELKRNHRLTHFPICSKLLSSSNPMNSFAQSFQGCFSTCCHFCPFLTCCINAFMVFILSFHPTLFIKSHRFSSRATDETGKANAFSFLADIFKVPYIYI